MTESMSMKTVSAVVFIFIIVASASLLPVIWAVEPVEEMGSKLEGAFFWGLVLGIVGLLVAYLLSRK